MNISTFVGFELTNVCTCLALQCLLSLPLHHGGIRRKQVVKITIRNEKEIVEIMINHAIITYMQEKYFSGTFDKYLKLLNSCIQYINTADTLSLSQLIKFNKYYLFINTF